MSKAFGLIAIFATLLATTGARADMPVAEDCLAKHLKDAIALNRARKPLYSELTQGRSEEISDLLISFEKLGIFTAYFYDYPARSFQEAGIPVICDDLASMSEAPQFATSAPKITAPFVPMNVAETKAEIKAAYARGGFEEVSEVSQSILDSLADEPGEHCLFRHFISSITRTASIAPKHIEKAKELNLPTSPAGLEWSFIRLQLLGLEGLEKIDELAAPLQAEGIPILCQDIPQIPNASAM